MKRTRLALLILTSFLVVISFTLFSGTKIYAAYNHAGDADKDPQVFLSMYPDAAGTKLDSCATCHRGGKYPPDARSTMGSCQYCHAITNYGSLPDQYPETLNSYGQDYLEKGRNESALKVIESLDSDMDTYTNVDEINALRYPGDMSDDPLKIPAPAIVFSLEQLERLPQHTQFLLMNASKSDDSYTEYTGVALENLLKATMLDSATGITVYSPDGFAQDHPLQPANNYYHVFGIYPKGMFYYNERADIARYPVDVENDPDYLYAGWCDYSAPEVRGRKVGPISNPQGLKMILALKRHAHYLESGVLNSSNKLDGEGPFRVAPPQKTPGWPDQRSYPTSKNQAVIWPYDPKADHNAGSSTRTVTMIKVKPLPAGTTDINTLEAGWPYVDEKKIIIYGAIDPHPEENIDPSLNFLIDTIKSQNEAVFKVKSNKAELVKKIELIREQVAAGAYAGALTKLKEDILQKTDGYLSETPAVDGNDWINDLDFQKQVGTEIQRICVMLVILAG